MGTLTFDFPVWDDEKDFLLNRPGNQLGYTAVLCSLDVGDMQTVRGRKRDTLIRECEEGVVGLLAGSLEFLRSRGYSAEEVQNKVLSYKNNNRDTHKLVDQTVLASKPVRQAITGLSNPDNLELKETIVIG